MDKNYVYYDNTIMYSTNKPTRIKTENINDCFSECTYPSCQGMGIYKANCNNKNYCDSSSKLKNFNCDIINNVSKTNLVKSENNTVSLINKSNFTFSENLFNIKTMDNKCLNFDKYDIGNLQSSCMDFKTDKNKIYTNVENKYDTSLPLTTEKKCISVNGTQINLTSCNNNNDNNNNDQAFINDTIFNTIRPYNNTKLCFTNDNNIINLTNCTNSKKDTSQIFNLSDVKIDTIDTFSNTCNNNKNYDILLIILILIILLLFFSRIVNK